MTSTAAASNPERHVGQPFARLRQSAAQADHRATPHLQNAYSVPAGDFRRDLEGHAISSSTRAVKSFLSITFGDEFWGWLLLQTPQQFQLALAQRP